MRGKEREGSKRYQKFVESGLAENDDEFMEILKGEVAVVLNAGSGSAISRQLLRYRKISTEDKQLNKLLMRCESILKEERTK